MNPSKSELLWCATLRRRHYIIKKCFTLPDGDVQPVGSVRNLGAFFDSDMSMKTHVNRLVSSCYYQLRRIPSIRRSIPTTMAITLMNSFILNRVDYCNSLLVSLPAYQTDRIQIVLNDAARLIFGGSRSDHVTPILRQRLHWLSATRRIEFKVALLMYKGINNLSPDYITSYCISSSINQRRFTLRSADKGNLIEPKTVTEFRKRSLAFAGPHLWNKLPINIRQSSSVDIFKKRP